MSQFIEKSKLNFSGAEALVKSTNYPSSVKCFYYSCVLNMLHIIYNKFGYDEVKFDTERRHLKKGSHEYAASLIESGMLRSRHEDYKWFQRNIVNLKLLREKADYTDKEIFQEDAEEALGKASALNTILTTLF